MQKVIRKQPLSSKHKNKRHFQVNLIFNNHKIEKGLSMSNPRVGYGEVMLYYCFQGYIDDCAKNPVI